MADLESESQIFLSVVLGLVVLLVALYVLFFNKKKTEENNVVEESRPEKKIISSNQKVNIKQQKNLPNEKKEKRKNPSSVKDNGANNPLLITSLKGHTGNINSLDFSTNGKVLASCSEDRTIRLWYVKEFKEKDHKYARVNVEFDYASSVSFAPDSRAFIVSLGTEHKMRVFKIHKEKKEGINSAMSISHEFDFPKVHKADIISVGISSTGKYIMSADSETQIIIWSVKGDVLDKIDTLLMYNTTAQVSPCGNLVAACGFTSEVKLWHITFSKNGDFQQSAKAFEIKGHKAGVLAFSFTNDTKRLGTVSKDGTWKVWDINVNYQKGQEAYLLNTGTFAGYEEGVPIQIGLSHDYFTVAVSVGQHLTYFDSRTGEQGDEILHAHPGNINALRWYSDSKMLVTSGSTDRMVRVWENVVGAKANLEDLKEKLLKNTSASIKERIENQISEYQEFLAKFNNQ